MISCEFARVVEEHFFFWRYTKHASQLLSIPLHSPLAESSLHGLEPTLPHGCFQEAFVAASKRKTLEDTERLVRIHRELAPELFSKCGSVARGTRTNHHDVYTSHTKSRFFLSETSNLLAAKDSAKVTDEDEQRIRASQQVAETHRFPVLIL